MRTNAGADFQAAQMSGAASATAVAKWLGVTANTAAAAATDTTLAGEIAAGTLIRSVATYAHTTGTASYTLTKTLTSDQTITLAKIGIFDAVTVGNLVFETLMNATAALISGDSVTITETVNI